MIPDEALDADIAILGKKGRGKTYTAKGLVERLLEMERRVLVLDPLSVWWGLKSDKSGKKPGFPVAVFGGPHGDMKLTEKAARPLAKLIAHENLPAVVDMGEMRKAAWQRLVRDMLDELFAENRDPLWIVLEEADVFAPQQPREGDSSAVLGEVDRIARRGRAYGFRLISVTQRPARLHKDVLTQLSTLVALGMTSPQDRDAIKSWIEGNADRDQAKEVLDTLAKLPVGEGWVWAPDHDLLQRVKFPKIKTLDTSATPKAGEKRIEPKKLAAVDLTEFQEALQAAEEEATPKQKDAGTRQPTEKELQDARVEGYQDGHREGYQQGVAVGVEQERARIRRLIDDAPIPTIESETGEFVPITTKRTAKARQCDAGSEVNQAGKASRNTASTAPSAALKMLQVLDTDPPIKMTWGSLAASIGNKARGGHFNSVRKWLLENDKVIEESGLVRIAKPSQSAARPMSAAELGQHLRERWKSILGGRAAEIIDVLHHEKGASKPFVAGHLNCANSGGHWNSAWKSLRDNDLIEKRGDQFFLKGEIAG